MTQWFDRFVRRVFLRTYSEQEPALRAMAGQVQAMRQHLYQLYEEVDLAIRALDLLGDRVEAARQRVQIHVETPVEPRPALVPRTFTHADRQRDDLKRGVQ
jgi:hypothetical protein